MYKRILIAAFSLISLGLASQPLTYYQDAYNEDGGDLREALSDIIYVHTRLPYSSSTTDTWDVLKVSDRDTANSSNVILIYAGVSVDGAQEYNGGNGWTREHVWPKSLGGFSTSAGPGTDVHNLKPADNSLNSLRSNLEYDDLGTGGSAVNYNGSATGNRYNSSAGVFEPRDAIKGDVARIILYMDLRYEGAGTEPDLVVREALNTGGTTFAVMSELIAWHWADPVDSFEMNRNNVIHQMQGNRNPFIDHPELVDYLYGDSTNVAWNPFMGSAELASTTVQLYPNPVQDVLVIKADHSSPYSIFDLSGRTISSGMLHPGEQKISLGCYEAGTYVFRAKNFVQTLEILH